MVHSQKIFAAIVGLLLLATPALGETMTFKADLKAASEVPP